MPSRNWTATRCAGSERKNCPTRRTRPEQGRRTCMPSCARYRDEFGKRLPSKMPKSAPAPMSPIQKPSSPRGLGVGQAMPTSENVPDADLHHEGADCDFLVYGRIGSVSKTDSVACHRVPWPTSTCSKKLSEKSRLHTAFHYSCRRSHQFQQTAVNDFAPPGTARGHGGCHEFGVHCR
jgi:hypothetical protein